jgi:hypothetical protein
MLCFSNLVAKVNLFTGIEIKKNIKIINSIDIYKQEPVQPFKCGHKTVPLFGEYTDLNLTFL